MGRLDQDFPGARPAAAERDLDLAGSGRRPGVALELERLGLGQGRPVAVAIRVERADGGGRRGVNDHAADLDMRVDQHAP